MSFYHEEYMVLCIKYSVNRLLFDKGKIPGDTYDKYGAVLSKKMEAAARKHKKNNGEGGKNGHA